MVESLHIVITVTAIITDPVAISTTDVSMITNNETGTLDPYIPTATDALTSALISAVGQKLRGMPGVKFGACSAQLWPRNDDGSYKPIPPPGGLAGELAFCTTSVARPAPSRPRTAQSAAKAKRPRPSKGRRHPPGER